MKKTIGILALVACAGVASASTSFTPSPTIVDSVTFTNVASVNGLNDGANILGGWGNTGSGTVDQIRVTGTLTEVNTGTYANEALVRISAGAGNTFPNLDIQGSTTGNYTGSIAVNRTINVTPFSLAAGTVNFQWYESYNDGAGADSNWDSVTYEFVQSAGPTVITNGNVNLGAITGTTTYSGSHVSGGLDFITFSVPAIVNPGDSLYIGLSDGLTGVSMDDTEIALYDAAGNQVGYNDDIGFPNYFSELSYDDLAPLAGGTYTLVTAGYNSSFPLTLGGTFSPGTNAGTYELAITYVPTPGALALLGMGGLIANRRRR